ncbi:hypothetical protein MD588_21840 [Photobacterium sp. SDRW27]|uniref:type I-F CRISPR-associated protein Csy2 n=1 Tax=Photobacterium obscurum TaxID=2829490 RepID=UPI002244AF80|nr:type I-F CRISPR-associated protein Csy2 [Photobacterium obscurum]MCW8331440.1 hypothetical protein [Photobacterium obscurum]
MDIKKLLDDTDSGDVDHVLRKAFSPVTVPLEISTGLEPALITLINLTDKTSDQSNLLCKNKCKEKLRDQKWWVTCLNTVQSMQSHNVKFPDYQATGTIRTLPKGALPPHLLSSSKLANTDWHYARNSACVNKSAFLCSEFELKGTLTKLAELLKDEASPIWKSLRRLGCYAKYQKQAVNYLKNIEDHILEVTLTPNNIRQVTFPVNENEYITLTPTLSQTMQAQIHRELEDKRRLTAIYHCDRAPNIGYFVAKAGGRIRTIKTQPHIPQTQEKYTPAKQWLTKPRFEAMDFFLERENLLITANHKKRMHKAARKQIKNMLLEWQLGLADYESLNSRELAQGFNYCLSRTRNAHRFAYLPELTQLFEELFAKPSPHNELPTQHDKSQHSSDYMIIPKIKIGHANAESSGYTIGLPSLIGIFGYLHAFERRVRKDYPKFSFKRFALRLERFHLERRGITLEASKIKNENIAPPALRDSWQCDMTMSVLLECESADEVKLAEVPRWLPNRLCRGHTHIPHEVQDRIQISHDLKLCIKELQQQPGLWLLADEHHEITDVQILLEQIDTNRLVTCLGYHLISSPATDKGSMYGYPHAFCEPVLGLVCTMQSIHHKQIDSLLWRYQWVESGPILTTSENNDETAK